MNWINLAKRTIGFLKYGFLFFVLFVFFYWGMAFVSSRISVNKSTHSDTSISIYILSNGVHTDVVVPIYHKNTSISWRDFVKIEHTLAKDTNSTLVAFGWGNKGFYLETPEWADLKFSVAFNAVFGLGGSAMHVTFHKQLKENKHCRKIYLSADQYRNLTKFILNQFSKSSSGEAILIPTKTNYGKNDAFYEANGRYNLFYTCNTWTNDALKLCGQKASLWTPFESGVMRHYPQKRN